MDKLSYSVEHRPTAFDRACQAARFVVERLTGGGEVHPSGRDTSRLGVSAYFDRTVMVEPIPVPTTSRRLPLGE